MTYYLKYERPPCTAYYYGCHGWDWKSIRTFEYLTIEDALNVMRMWADENDKYRLAIVDADDQVVFPGALMT